MKLTKSKLKKIIKEELSEIEDEGLFDDRPQEENQEPVVFAFEALKKAREAVEALEPPFRFSGDSPIHFADLDNQIHYINRSWRKHE